MSKIACSVCQDLMPLVKDGIASKESCDLVKEHMKGCTVCQQIYYGDSNKLHEEDPHEGKLVDDTRIVKKIQKQLILGALGIMILGMFLGLVLDGGMGMFYNVLIMPAIGAVGYLALRKKVYVGTVILFIFSSAWIAIREIADGAMAYSNIGEILTAAAVWSSIYTLLFIVGVMISSLLRYAFKKEDI